MGRAYINTPSPSAILGTCVALPVIGTFTVALRFYARHTQKSAVRIEDVLCVVSLIFLWGMAITMIASVSLRWIGYPMTDFPDPSEAAKQVEGSYKLEFIVELFELIQLGSIKLSFVLFFKHIFTGTIGLSKVFGYVCWIMIALVLGWTVAFFLALLLSCPGARPYLFWKLGMPVCGGLPLQYAFGLTDTLLDGLVIFMPLPMIWQLHMSTPRKFAVAAGLLLGAFAVVASVIRLIIEYQARDDLLHVRDVDVLLLITKVQFWFFFESSIALIAACLPLIYGAIRGRTAAIVRDVFGSMGMTNRSKTQNSGGSKERKEVENNRSGSSSSNHPIVQSWIGPASADAYAMKSFHKKGPHLEFSEDIQVTRDITQHTEIV
ncbi:MAG: hypothetical protein M1820_006538 [Bogoriella megaspora]|nr:MAG: hypothetical protein M1820_006538 [Bogoriella megaspora]